MSENTSANHVAEWLIAPESHFDKSSEVAAQIEVLEAENFLEVKSECETAFARAFQDADAILTEYMPMLTDPALSKEAFKKRLPSEDVGYGALHGRKGLMVSRLEKAKRKRAVEAAYDARVSLLRLKDLHHNAYASVLAKVKAARRVANIGIPRLSKPLKGVLAELHGLDRVSLEKAVTEHAISIQQIDLFHLAIKTRFGLSHQIFGKPNTHLTADQRVHIEVLKIVRPQIIQAQSLDRAIACLEFNESVELELEREWEPDWGR